MTENIVSIVENTQVKAIYDGFQVKVNIIADSKHIECACYLYLNEKIYAKSYYENNNKHIFYLEKCKLDRLEVKVFFRYRHEKSKKISQKYNVCDKDNIIYGLSEKRSFSLLLSDFEIFYSNQKAIEKYELEGFRPRKDNKALKLALPINWSQDPFNDKNWMFQLQAWRMLDFYLSRCHVQDLEVVSNIINDWVNFEQNNRCNWLWYDMSTGLRALKITYYLLKCKEMSVEHKINDLDYLLQEHFRHLSNIEELNLGNHGLFQLNGLKSLCFICKVYDLDTQAIDIEQSSKYANEQMCQLITSQLGLYGVHTEDSPDYHFFTHKKIMKIVVSPWWEDLDVKITKLLNAGEDAKPWLVFPDNTCVPIGDSSTGSVFKNLRELEKWSHSQIDDERAALIDGYAVVRTATNVPLKKSFYLFFQGSFHSQVHKHRDDLSFVLQERGVNLLIDSGKYGYKKDKYRNYFLSTRAHNTIEVGNENTARINKYAYGSAIKEAPRNINGFWVLRGKVHHVLNGYIHDRVIIYKPRTELYVLDTIITENNNGIKNVNQWWHFDTETQLVIDEKTGEINVRVHDYSDIRISVQSSAGLTNHDVYKGYEVDKDMMGWVSKSYLSYEPTPTLKISTLVHKKTLLLTHFKLNKELGDENILNLLGDRVETKYYELAEFLGI